MPAPDVSTLARKYRVDVELTPSTWTQVKGLQEFKPALNPDLQDDGVYDDEGWGSQTKTGLAWTAELKLIRRVGAAAPTTYDPGQEGLRAAAEVFGSDGVVHVRWYDKEGGPEAYDGYAEVSWVPDGGNRTALETVTVTLTGKGARNTISNPA